MRIFINDIPVRIVDSIKNLGNVHFHDTIDASKEEISQNRLIHHVLIQNMNTVQLENLLRTLHKYIITNLYSLTITSHEFEQIQEFLNKNYKVIKAAGGLVRKKDKVLMIYRLKKWDLPKGKLEKSETSSEGAIREVEEECNIKVKLNAKICSTYHTYTMKNKNILKKTTWYLMDCIDDSKKKPQLEEDIEELKWMTLKEVHHALQNSYRSITHVFNKYYNMPNIKDYKVESH